MISSEFGPMVVFRLMRLNVTRNLKKLYEVDYLSLKKNKHSYEQNEEKKKSKLESLGFEKCFDIAACSHFKKAKTKQDILSSTSCDCPAAKKIPVQELEFYSSQLFDRDNPESLLVIGSKIDQKTSKIYGNKRP